MARCSLLLLLAAGCSSSSPPRRTDTNRVGSIVGGAPDNPANSGPLRILARCSPECPDLPSEPLFDAEGTAPPRDASQLFGAADSFASPGVCVIEPQLSVGDTPGALFPSNWLRPRFRWTPLPGENLWEIRISAMNQAHTLVAYTKQTHWKLPKPIWKGLAEHSPDMPINVTIRGVDQNAPKKPSGTRGSFVIAPAEARGKLVYWATTSSEVKPDTSKLVGFDVGDEGVIEALTIARAGDRGVLQQGGRELRGKYDDARGVPAGHVQCIGCHVSTPDGDAVAFVDNWPWNNVLASIEEGSAGALPKYVSPAALRLLSQPWMGMPTFSRAHWKTGDRIMVTVYSPRNDAQGGVGFSDGAPYPSRHDRLAWFDLEAMGSVDATDPSRGDAQQQVNMQVRAQSGVGFGLLALDGETRSVAAPSFSHDGTRILYTSADATQDGRVSGNNQEVDVHVVQYGERMGGQVTPVRGAAEPHVAEYYPAYAADDSLIAFNRVAKLDGAPMYYRADGEVYVVPGGGGDATRLLANDPPACTGQKSPGVINSWPKWSPSVMPVAPRTDEFGPGFRKYYWLVFSSARAYEGQFELPKGNTSPGDTRSSQLYITAVVRNESSGKLETFPALYIWNQDPRTSNLTPAWDEFKLPPVPAPD